MALWFSSETINTNSVSAQLGFRKSLACVGMNHVIKGERPQKTRNPRDKTPLTPAFYSFSVDFARLRIV